MKKNILGFLAIVFIIFIILKIFVKTNDDDKFLSQEEMYRIPKKLEQKKEDVAVNTYSQDPETQKIVEWLSNPSGRPDVGETYLAPILVVPELYKSLYKIEVNDNVLFFLINVDKGYEYLRRYYSSGAIECENFAWELMRNAWSNLWMLTTADSWTGIGYSFNKSLFDEFPKIKSIVIEITKISSDYQLDQHGNKLPDKLEKQIIIKLKVNRTRASKQKWSNILNKANEKYLPFPSMNLNDPYAKQHPKQDYEGAIKFLQRYLDGSSLDWTLIRQLCQEEF